MKDPNRFVAWAEDQAERAARLATENWGAPIWESMTPQQRQAIVAKVLDRIAIEAAQYSFQAPPAPIIEQESLRSPK